jgi:hypothetical protein
MRVPALVILGTVVCAASASAQIIRQPQRAPQPSGWTSVSVGILYPLTVHDGTTASEWQFGNAVQYRVSVEMPLQNQATLGISGAFARVPLTYVPLSGNLSTSCFSSCDADATVTQLYAIFHAGGSPIGFHQVLDLAVGATGYSSFRERRTGEKLAPTKLDADFSLAFGYGFGYTLAPGMEINLVSEGSLTVHQRTGVAGGEDTLGRLIVLRLGMRFGL